jgi:hypothetical protein
VTTYLRIKGEQKKWKRRKRKGKDDGRGNNESRTNSEEVTTIMKM